MRVNFFGTLYATHFALPHVNKNTRLAGCRQQLDRQTRHPVVCDLRSEQIRHPGAVRIAAA